MLYIKSREEFIIRETYAYIDDFIISEGILDEDKIKEYILGVLKRVKDLTSDKKRKLLIYAIAAIMSVVPMSKALGILSSGDVKTEISNDKESREIIDSKLNLHDGTNLKLSQNGWDHIKKEEGLKLKAYKIGDGKITVGYGHAEPIKTSKYKVGQSITMDDANKLLREDAKVAADGVRRVFAQWKDQGIDVKITQGMFDALVSMAFNMGVGSLRQSDVLALLKKGNYKEAGESIKDTSVSDKYPGLEVRREKEAEMFFSA